ncbi:conserved protein of unknown function [Ectopseudomonas oleovorans]|uniref:Uncharacterized protein n=1 Tax=Ectopseudomonas oleovorans TaxID=301 RepID=A0A653AYW0_ECTOL|nr:conserved protein of unknown function [Pseudomonas oleovorans]
MRAAVAACSAIPSHFRAAGASSGVVGRVSANPVTLLGLAFPLDLSELSGMISVPEHARLRHLIVRAYPVGSEGPQ